MAWHIKMTAYHISTKHAQHIFVLKRAKFCIICQFTCNSSWACKIPTFISKQESSIRPWITYNSKNSLRTSFTQPCYVVKDRQVWTCKYKIVLKSSWDQLWLYVILCCQSIISEIEILHRVRAWAYSLNLTSGKYTFMFMISRAETDSS